MDPIEIPVDSDALRANLPGTAQTVVIPERYLPLLEAVEGYHGVKTPLAETLAEYFHGYRNVDLLVDGFQTILLRNWTYFERSEDRARAFALLSELILDLLDTALSAQQASLLLRQLLTWCSAALGGAHSDEYDEPLQNVAACLSRFVSRQSLASLERDTLLHGLVQLAARRPALEPVFSELYRSVLLLGYHRVEERLPIPEWATSGDAELTDPQSVAAGFADLAPKRVQELIAKAETATTVDLLSAELPTFSAVLDQSIDQVFRIDNVEDRFAVCLYFLKDDTLGYRQNEVMVDLLAVVRQLMKPESHMDVDRILSRLTRFFRARENQFLLMRF